MNRLFAFALATLFLGGCTVVPPADDRADYYYDDGYGADFPPDGEFAELWRWGTWIAKEPYGWVWQPDVVSSWAPYRHGHWILSQWGWTWVSYEPFGWATYHYGHWFYDPVWGWLWAPDYVWMPANVQWIVDYDYIAWTPALPGGARVRDPWMTHTPEVWTVVPIEHFTHLDIGRFGRPVTRMKPSAGAPGTREAPSVSIIEQTIGRRLYPEDVELAPVMSGSHEYQRLKLRGDHRRAVQRFAPQVEKRVLKPRPDRDVRSDRRTRDKDTRTEDPRMKKEPDTKRKKSDGKTKDKR